MSSVKCQAAIFLVHCKLTTAAFCILAVLAILITMPRYASSRVLKPVKAFLRVEGIAWIVATILLGCTVAWSVLSIYSSVTAEGPHDSSWSNFASIASRWFVFNVAAMIFLALLEGPTWGVVGPKAPKFDLFPLFSWQVKFRCPLIILSNIEVVCFSLMLRNG